MKLGVSTYAFYPLLKRGEMDILEVVQWIADNGGEHVEIVPQGYQLDGNWDLVDEIRGKAEEVGIRISNVAEGANFVKEDNEDYYKRELERVIRWVDITHRLGAKHMRHDVAFRPHGEIGIMQFEKDLELLVDACRQIADYAAQFDITTSVENHGTYVQHSDRVQRLVVEVDRPNFRTLLDTCNFLCVDEDPVAAVKNNLPYASMIHLKDFYWRPSYRDPGELWFQTTNGNYLRGAILGQGDVDVREIIRIIKHSGFVGDFSLEYEGKEDIKTGTRIGIENAKRIWDEV